MNNLKFLIFKPAIFFKEKSRLKNIDLRKILLWGLICGFLSQLISYLYQIFYFYLAKNALANIDQDISEEFLKKIEIDFFFYIFVITVILIPIITILLRNILGWITLKIIRAKGVKLSDINILVCFSMITNFWNIIPIIGFILTFIHLFLLAYIAARNFFQIQKWKAFIFAFIISFINLQPFFYTVQI